MTCCLYIVLMLSLCVAGGISVNPRLLYTQPCPSGCEFDICALNVGCARCLTGYCKLYTQRGYDCLLDCPYGMYCNSDGHCMDKH